MINYKKLNNEETEKVSGGKFIDKYDREDIGYLLFYYADVIGCESDAYRKLDALYDKIDKDEKVYSVQEALVALINEYPPLATYMLKRAKNKY